MNPPDDGGVDGTALLDQRTRQTLEEMVEFGAMSRRLVAKGRPAYDEDEYLRLASEAVAHKLGEAVARLPDEFVEAHPEVPWRGIKGLRNKVAHQYEQVDYNLIWNGFEQQLPANIEQIQKILLAG